MSTTIDERVVSMDFDNRRFEQNVSTSMSTLEKLKQSLNLTSATKGLEDVDNAARRVDMSPLGNAVETVRARFSALQVMGITALTNITNQAVNAGKRIVSALTIDPIKTGFQEYETQINAVQTILANTESKGTTLKDVTAALDQLNTYADKTIYNFTEMTRNIGTFTAAGIDLETSVSSIQGIANLAAVSGSTSQQASTAMYQLSQALASGTVKLMDWNSVVNAGMGGQVFQDALKRTATVMGTNVDKMIKDAGSFRESLKDGWITAEVLTETLNQFTMSAEEGTEEWDKFKKSLIDKGYSEEQAKSILKMANTATDAATKVKTLTQLWDTLKESAQSGWTQSWELLVGDFEEAKETFTKISDRIGTMIGESADARNNLLAGALTSSWDQLIGKINDAGISTEEFEKKVKKIAKKKGHNIEGLLEDYETLEHVFETGELSAGLLRDAISNLSASQLTSIKYTDEFKKKLKETAKEQGYNIDGLLKDYGSLEHLFETGELEGGVFAETMDKLSDAQLKSMGYTEGQIDKLRSLRDIAYKTSTPLVELTSTLHKTSGRELLIESLWNAFDGLLSVVEPVKQALKEVFPPMTSKQLYNIIEGIHKFSEGLKISEETADKIKRTFKGLFSIFDILRKGISAVVGGLFDLSQSKGISSLADLFLDITASIGDFFTSLNKGFDSGGLSGGISKAVSGLSNFIGMAVKGFQGFADILSTIGGYIVKAVNWIWDGIKTAYNWIADNISAGDIFAGLAGGGIFMAAKKLMGFLDGIQDTIQNLFKKGDKGGTKFGDVLESIKGSLESFTSGIKVWSLVGIAGAVTLLSSSLGKISKLDADDIGKSLLSIGIMIKMLTSSFDSITKSLKLGGSKGVVKTAFAMILMAKAVDILADSMIKLAELELTEIGKGLVALGGGMGELVLGVKALDKVKVDLKTSAAMLALAESCGKIADALVKFGDMQWDEIARGLVAMGGALGEFVLVLKGFDKVGGWNSLAGSGSLLIAVESLDELAAGLEKFASMSWDEIGRGLAGMGGALVEVGGVTGALGYLTGFSGILGGGALVVAVQSLGDLADGLKKFGDMQWDEIGRGLAAMGGALTEVGTVTGALGYLAGFSGILGGGALVVAVQSLSDLATAFQQFGSMSWGEIGRGLAAMGGALTEVGVVTGALGYLTGFAGVIGGGTIWVAIQGLGDLATAFQQFGSMSWDEIGRGLVAMGGALTEVGVVTGALGYLTGFAGVIGSGSILIAVQGLSDIADALQKFGSMSWDEIGRGLAAMGGALGEVALGGFLNTLSGIGAMAISEIAEPLGVLAESLKKWKDVTVPENLGWNLSQLANGIFSFTFGGNGASALATAAPAIGQLADSVMKWSGVTIPEGLSEDISSLSSALSGWWNEGLSASALADAAPAIGQMADSIKKWSDVTIPENLTTTLSGLATAVHGFTFSGNGAGNLTEAAPGVTAMANAVASWANITVPENLGSDLESLGAGVKAFNFSGSGAGSIAESAPGISQMADSVKKWTGVTVSEDLIANLKDLASGVKAFTFGGMGASALSEVAGPLGVLADSVIKWSGVTIPEGLSEKVSGLSAALSGWWDEGLNASALADAAPAIGIMADSIKKWSGVTIPEGFNDTLSGLATAISGFSNTDISTTAEDFGNLSTNFTELSKVPYTTISDGLSSISTSISKLKKSSSKIEGIGTTIYDEIVTPLKNTADDLSGIGSDLIGAIATGMQNQSSATSTAVTSIISAAKKAISNKYDEFETAGQTVMVKLISGIKAKYNSISSTAETAAGKAVSGVRDKYGAMVSAGTYLGEGLVEGIAAKETAAYNAGYALGQAAVQGEKDGQKSNSPSKLTIQAGKWIGEGLVIGIRRMTSKVYDSGHDLGETATKSISSAVSTISDSIDSDIETQPTIRPVLDLSDVRSGANAINGMLNTSSIGVNSNINAIRSMMRRNGQNGANSEVISAINKIRKDLGNVGNTTYVIDGITYDDGSNIADAVQTIVRMAKRERRA